MDEQRTKRSLRPRADHYRLLVEELKDFAVFMLDPQGRITSWNAGAKRILGYTNKEIIGQPFARIFTPEDVNAGVPERELARAAAADRADDDRWHIRKDGSRFWAAGSTTAYRDRDGHLLGFAKIVRDGTEKRKANEALRESEARYRLLADFVPQMEWTARPDGVLDFCNRRWSEYTGLTLDQAQDAGWRAVVHPDDVPSAVARWNEAIVRGDHFDAEFRLRRASDGTYRWHLARAVPVKDDASNVLKWFGTCTDIDEQKHAEAERDELLAREKSARAEAEAANRIKDEFLAVLSHELRTPLTSVLAWVNVLRAKGSGDAEADEGLAVIERNTRLQARLIDDLLDVSRIVAGKLRLDADPIELVPVIRAAADAVRVAADAKGIDLRLDLDPAAGAVQGDAGRLQQVVWNLLANAVKFTPKGGSVTVQLHRVHSQVEIRVSDTGQGITPDLLPFVFDRFRQGDKARRQGGLGLGLAIARHLVELHGGTIQAESGGEGQGATFTVELPLFAVRHDDVGAVKERQAGPSDLPGAVIGRNLAGVRILVVEDEADARRALVKVLRVCGAEVQQAGSAAEALAELERSIPNVIVCDVGLPGDDGYSLIRKVRSLSPKRGGNVPAVAVTGYAGLEDRRKALEAGFQMHLAKPVTLAELASVVANLAGRTT